MKLVGIVGSIADESYNRQLMLYIASHFKETIDIEILDIRDVPMFKVGMAMGPAVDYLNQKIIAADGVILATPEHNHTTTAALKNVIEWLSASVHPFTNKPVLLVGASYFEQGSGRAQMDLRQILEAPGINALVMPKDEFLLGNVKTAFDDSGNLKEERTIHFLESVMASFLKWINVLKAMQAHQPEDWEAEDLTAAHAVDTTVKDVDMRAEDWLEQAAEKTQAVEGDTYVKLDQGLLTVNQLNWFLNTMPVELTFADDNNQFIYYNRMDEDPKNMLAPRQPKQVGDPLSSVHPDRAIKGAKQVVHALRTGKTDLVSMPVPFINKVNEKHVMHYYKAMHDADGRYRGINEWVVDIWPIVASYLQMTGQKLIMDDSAKPQIEPNPTATDATSGASGSKPTIESTAPADVDATSGASESY
ncbi:MAG: NADPH-dependent oxidoreductase [Aerococcus sp.]|nr:NADPH-dependent oxidoreductase [Aerococcus sp.]